MMILHGTLSEYYSYSVFGMILAGIFCWNNLLVSIYTLLAVKVFLALTIRLLAIVEKLIKNSGSFTKKQLCNY